MIAGTTLLVQVLYALNIPLVPVEIMSGPMAFLGFSHFSKASTPFVVTNMSMIWHGSRMKWANSVKDLGNYIAYDLSESEEIRHKELILYGELMEL